MIARDLPNLGGWRVIFGISRFRTTLSQDFSNVSISQTPDVRGLTLQHLP